jgi:hypothetical protein
VHWYGVIALGLMAGAFVVARGRDWKQGLLQLWPASAGGVALVLCVPLSVGQRHALSVSTWVADFSFAQLTTLLGTLWATLVPLTAILLISVGIGFRRRRAKSAPPSRASEPDGGVYSVLSLALMPFVLAALSLVGQPSMVARYALPAVLVWAPLAATAAVAVGRWPQRALALGLAWLWLTGYRAEAHRKRVFDSGIRQLAVSLRQADALGVPVVFANMHTLYAVSALPGIDRASLAFLEITDSATSTQLTKSALIERDVVRVHAARFGFPRLLRQVDLRRASRFAIVGLEPNLSGGYADLVTYGRLVFPEHCLSNPIPGVTLAVTGMAKCY